jgi:hypothetical protein
VGSVDNISAMEFKRYDSSSYQMARDASVWGKSDPSLEDTVDGILKFMYRKGIISVAARQVNAVPPLCGPELTIETHRRVMESGAGCLQRMADGEAECSEEITKVEASEQV